jgi:zona occludens toxin (predicted ATPase)
MVLNSVALYETTQDKIQYTLKTLSGLRHEYHIDTEIFGRHIKGDISFIGDKLVVVNDIIRDTRICIHYRDMKEFELYNRTMEIIQFYKVLY